MPRSQRQNKKLKIDQIISHLTKAQEGIVELGAPFKEATHDVWVLLDDQGTAIEFVKNNVEYLKAIV